MLVRNGRIFFFSSRRRHTRLQGDWSSDVCSSDLVPPRRVAGLLSWGGPVRRQVAAGLAGTPLMLCSCCITPIFQSVYERGARSEEHTSELQSPCNLVCRLLLEKKKTTIPTQCYSRADSVARD